MKLISFRRLAPAVASIALASCAAPVQPGLKDVVGDRFTIGVAANGEQMAGRDSVGTAIIKRHFNSIVAENVMKCQYIPPEEGRYDFAGADSLMAFAEANGMEVIGHCLVWHSMAAPWFFVDSAGNEVSAEVLRQRMVDHIKTVVGRYKGRVKGWDVCNEVIVEDGGLRDSPYSRALGYNFIYEALELTHQIDPDAEIYINDYGMTNPGRRAGYLALIDSIRSRGIRLDAMGLQGHMGIDYPDSASVVQTLDDFKKIGLPVMITEWDMGALPTVTQSADVTVGDSLPSAKLDIDPFRSGLSDSISAVWNTRMRMFWDIFISRSADIKRVTVWGVRDGDSWKNDFPVLGRTDYPLLFDREGEPKPFVRDILADGAAN